MVLIKKQYFIDWVKEHGIQIDTRPQCYSLSLSKGKLFSKSLKILEENCGNAIPYFFLEILNKVDEWETCYIWKINGKWNYYINERFRPLENVWASLLHKIGIPMGFEGAIEYKRSELWDLLSFLHIQTSFMWCGSDQFFVVFDHAQQLIFVDEDRNLHVEFVDQKRLNEFVSDLSSLDYPAK